jgi:hypothetical protein
VINNSFFIIGALILLQLCNLDANIDEVM